ncbi:MAG: hypothetical protein ACK4UO_06100 [Pseudolabrys sp.]
MTARERLPERRFHMTFQFEFDGQGYTAGVGYYSDGRPAEVFLNSPKIGAAVESLARDSAILISLALQHGVTLSDLHHVLTRDVRGSAMGLAGHVVGLLAQVTPKSEWCL